MKKIYVLLIAFIFTATLVSAQTINQGFEGTTFPPTGWTKASPDGGNGWNDTTVGITPVPGFQGGAVTACTNGGLGVAYCSWTTGGATSNNQWLITPQVNGVLATYAINFWMRKFGAYKDNLKVMASTSGNAVANFTITLATLNFVAADSGWINYNYSLSAYAGQNIYLAFNEYVADNAADGAFFSLDNVVVGPNTSIDELSTKIYTNVYPIPAKSTLNLETSKEINKIKIVNTVGQTVIEKEINSKYSNINIADLKSGIYFIQMNFAEGTITKKFVIEK